MDSDTTKTSLLSSRELQLRGWTKEAIKKLLSRKEVFVYDKIHFFNKKDVLTQEATDYFLRNKYIPSNIMESEAKRLRYFIDKHSRINFSILTFRDDVSLYNEAVSHYNRVTNRNIKLHRHMKMSFIARIVVNMLRHTCVEYVDILSEITKERTRTEIYKNLKKQVNKEIIKKYKKIGEFYSEN